MRRHQRGFLPKWSKLANVVEIDYFPQTYALEHKDPAFVLYDFTAASPSIAGQFTLDALIAFGPPPQVITIMSKFYQRTHFHIKLNGTTYGSFEASRAIRQECLLSPLIFTIASDSLLRVLQAKMSTTHLRTFADDTAAFTPSWRKNSKTITPHPVRL